MSERSNRADREFVLRAARIGIVGAAVAAAVLGLLWLLKAALTPLAAAFVLAYLFDPLIDRFEARRVRRGLAIAILLAVLGGGLAVFLFFVLPRLQHEAVALAERLPGYLERFATQVVPQIEERLGIALPRTVTEVVERVRAGELPLPLEALGNFAAGLLGTVTGTASALVGLLVVPILAYYLLVEFDALLRRGAAWIPPRQRDAVVSRVRRVDALVSRFLRGQVVIAGTLGVLYAAGFAVIGVDFALGVGLLAGVLALVPYLGNVVAVTLASLLAVLEFGFDGHLAAVLAWYVIVQTLEGFVLTPRVLGGSVGLHPAVVILALLIGGDLFGFLGLLLAVPGAAVVKVFVDELLGLYRGSSLFAAEPGAPAAAGESASPPGSAAPPAGDGDGGGARPG